MENRLYGNMGEIRDIDQEAIKIIQVGIDDGEDGGSGSGEKSDFGHQFSEGRVVRICL